MFLKDFYYYLPEIWSSSQRAGGTQCREWQHLSTWAIFCLLKCISRELSEKRSSWDLDRCSVGMLALQVLSSFSELQHWP